MNIHPNITPASPSLASPHFDVSFDSIESITTSFVSLVVPTLETTTVTEVALGYHRNQQYSITAMTTSTGAVAERYAYTAYGQPTILNASGTVLTNSAVGNRYTYTGREWDETLGLHHFRARWMSPLAGRFLGRDPIKYIGGFNLSSFVASRSLTGIDPLGLILVDHHLFPDSLGGLINALCPGFNHDDWTTKVDGGPRGHGNKYSEHWWWHYGCGNYVNDVQNLLDKKSNCCDFMDKMIELINNYRNCVATAMGKPSVPSIDTINYKTKQPTTWDPVGLVDKYCGGSDCKKNSPVPSNPHINVIPWWVPRNVENDIYQDVGIVVTCVVVGVVAGEVVVFCCPAPAAATPGVLGTSQGVVGNCVVRRVAIELAEELPLVLAP